MSGESIGKYDVLGTLGRGAHSTILHVRRHADAKDYALKLVPIDKPEHAKFQEQAQHEFRVAQLLDHPYLIKIHALDTTRDWLLRVRQVRLLIEYVNGKTLDSYPKLPLSKLVQVFQRAAAGMAHMHKRGVCHADMKPNNILLSRDGQVKVIDYGVAWLRGEHKARIQGTPEYLAPETAQKSLVNDRTDIFNFGAMMYRLVAGRHPPRVITKDGHFRIDAHTWERLLVPVESVNPQAPPELCDLIQRCLAFYQHNRPESAAAVEQVLGRLADNLVLSPEDRLERSGG